MPKLLLEALDFAARKHRDQRRKDIDASPYINHPITVARLVATVGHIEDTEILAAAVLHDTIEDTETTAEELQLNFGERVRNLVELATDDKTLSKQDRKRLQIDHAKSLPPDAIPIKLADKIANVEDVTNSPPSDWSRERRLEYLDWAEAVVDNCTQSNQALLEYFKNAVKDARLKFSR